MNTDLIQRKTATEMAEAWQTAKDEIQRGFALLANAEKRLNAAFTATDGLHDPFSILRQDLRLYKAAEAAGKAIPAFRSTAWAIIGRHINITKMMSSSRAAEWREQLQSGADLPEITVQNIAATIEAFCGNADRYFGEAVQEIFRWLRPRSGYKTNSEFKVGKKVILCYCVELCRFSCDRAGPFRIQYDKAQKINNLDNVFHLLDGQGTTETYHGPLHEAIEAAQAGKGETEYFRFRCCKNHNLHLWFKRPDLVDELNRIGAGGAPYLDKKRA